MTMPLKKKTIHGQTSYRTFFEFGRSVWEVITRAAKAYRCDGSATPMRGKSQTCRTNLLNFLAVEDRCKGSETLKKKKGGRFGKSETYRPSAWQSHCARSIR
jgi:hypothetical protein